MKIGILITARLKSTRLPMKLLLDLNGRSVIERIIDRCKKVHYINEIVLCTSTNRQDKVLIDIAQKNGIYYFNGSEEDVVSRLLAAAKLFDLDYFISLTADNPLISVYHANLVADTLLKQNKDFIKIIGLPFGTFVYGISVKALEVVCKIKNIVDTEIWGYLIDRPEVFNVDTIAVQGHYNKPDYRLTLDYEDDYKLFNVLYNSIPFNDILDLGDVIAFLNNNPDIAAINAGCMQKSADPELKNKIDALYENNIKKIIKLKNKIYRD